MNKFYSLFYTCLLAATATAQNLNQGFENPDLTLGGCLAVVGNAFSNESDFDDRVLNGTKSMSMYYVAIPPTPAYYISSALPSGNHTVSFYIKPSSCGASEAIDIGTVTNQNGDGFVPVCSQTVECSGSTVWEFVSCEISTLVINPYIAIRLNNTSKTYFFDDLAITNIGAPLPPSCLPLPINLLGLQARLQETSVLLEWTTASERNNKGFEVERRTNGDNLWSALGFVHGAGTATMGRDYAFVDNNPARGINYYRIRQVDINGQTNNFPILPVYNGQSTRLRLAPNPAGEQLTVNLGGGEIDEASRLFVMDAMGRTLLTQTFFGKTTTLNVAELPRGTYFVQVQSGGEWAQERILLR